MKYKINTRLQGTKQEYFTLEIWNDKGEKVHTHTAKSKSYLHALLASHYPKAQPK